MPTYEPDSLEFVSKGLDNVMPGKKIASMLAKSYMEKAKKNIDTARETAPKEFDRVMAKETARNQKDADTAKMHGKNAIRDIVGMEREYKKGGKVTASTRADGIAQRGKTKGKVI